MRVFINTPHRTAYRRFVSIWDSIDLKNWSVFGIDELPNTGITWKKYGRNFLFGVIGLRVYRNTMHSISSNEVSICDSIDPKYWSAFGIPSITNAEAGCLTEIEIEC